MQDLENRRVGRGGMVVERVDALIVAAGYLLDGIENRRVENHRGILRPNRAPEASASVAGLGEELAPPVFRREQGNNLVHFCERVAALIMPVVIKGHCFLSDRVAPPGPGPSFPGSGSRETAASQRLSLCAQQWPAAPTCTTPRFVDGDDFATVIADEGRLCLRKAERTIRGFETLGIVKGTRFAVIRSPSTG
jgi:hypothetical protein